MTWKWDYPSTLSLRNLIIGYDFIFFSLFLSSGQREPTTKIIQTFFGAAFFTWEYNAFEHRAIVTMLKIQLSNDHLQLWHVFLSFFSKEILFEEKKTTKNYGNYENYKSYEWNFYLLLSFMILIYLYTHFQPIALIWPFIVQPKISWEALLINTYKENINSLSEYWREWTEEKRTHKTKKKENEPSSIFQ